MAEPVRVLVVGLGNMGEAHARACHRNPGFRIAGLCSRGILSRDLPEDLRGYPRFTDWRAALGALRPDAVLVNTWPDTHAAIAIAAMEAGAHVFVEKPIGTTNAEAAAVVACARRRGRKLLAGYILRVHPGWQRFVEIGRTLGRPLVMRLNLNQQSSGEAWTWHRNLLESLTPIVDCGVHYVDVMCQLTGAKPLRVHGIGAALWEGAARQNYGQLQVAFEDGSVGWYEAGWGPMMSETAGFVKDVIGPLGALSMVPDLRARDGAGGLSDSADIDRHTSVEVLRLHHAAVDADRQFTRPDEILRLTDAPGHQELCAREQALFLRAIREDLDLSEQMQAAVDSLRIVLAAEESMRRGQVVDLD